MTKQPANSRARMVKISRSSVLSLLRISHTHTYTHIAREGTSWRSGEEGQGGEGGAGRGGEVAARVGRDSRWQRDIARFHISPLHPPSGFLSLLSRFTCHVSFFLLRFYTRSTDNCDTDRPKHVCKFVKMTDGRGQSAPQPIEKASLREKFPLIIDSIVSDTKRSSIQEEVRKIPCNLFSFSVYIRIWHEFPICVFAIVKNLAFRLVRLKIDRENSASCKLCVHVTSYREQFRTALIGETKRAFSICKLLLRENSPSFLLLIVG